MGRWKAVHVITLWLQGGLPISAALLFTPPTIGLPSSTISCDGYSGSSRQISWLVESRQQADLRQSMSNFIINLSP